MTIKYAEERTEATLQQLEDQIHKSCHPVRFGPLDFYKVETRKFTKPWLGQYDPALNVFKLFRTERGTGHTSDFAIKGKLLPKVDYTFVRYSIRIHYMLFLGLGGINICLYVLHTIGVSKDYLSSFWPLILAAIVVNTWFINYKRRDYLQTKKAFTALIHFQSGKNSYH